MNSLKRCLSVVVMISVVLSMLIFAQPALAASNMTLQQLQTKFPHGAYWNHYVNNSSEAADYLISVGDNRFADTITWSACASHSSGDLSYYVGKYDCNVFDGGMQCFGFARKLGYDAFGTYPSSWSKAWDMNSLKPGDIVRYMYDGHSIFVTGVSGDTITFADCNWGTRCIIRWNQTTTKSAIAGNGFNYVESAPSTLSTSTVSPSVTLDTSSWRYSIDETNAVVCANINNPNGGTIGTVGCYLYNSAGEYIFCHQEPCNPSYVTAATVPMWTNFNVDAGYTLQRGTTYQYRLYAYIDGVEYTSELASFTTGGKTSTPPTNAVLSVVDKDIALGENIVIHFSAENATKYTLYVGEESYPVTSGVVEHRPTTPGTYKIYMVAENEDGSVTSNSVNVNVIMNDPMGSAVVSVGLKEQTPMEIVRVPVYIDATIGIASCTARFQYDSNDLRFVDVEKGDMIDEVDYALLSGDRIELNCSSTISFTEKGTLAELIFYVNKEAVLGQSTIEIMEAVAYTNTENWYDNNQLTTTLSSGAVFIVDENSPEGVHPDVLSLGDLNGDTKIDAKDALEVLKATVGKTQLAGVQKVAADVNKDGNVDAKDALEILKKAVGKPACF